MFIINKSIVFIIFKKLLLYFDFLKYVYVVIFMADLYNL